MHFDPNQVSPEQSAGQLPKGTHLVVIERAEAKGSQSNQNNGYLEVVLRVVDGPAQGSTGADRLNIWNQNIVASEIALRRLSQYCHVTGHLAPLKLPDITPLYGKPFKVQVVEREGTQYTDIKTVMDVNGNLPRAGQPPSQAAAPAAVPAAPAPAPAPAPVAPAPVAPGWGGAPAPAAPAAAPAPQAAAPAWAQQAQPGWGQPK